MSTYQEGKESEGRRKKNMKNLYSVEIVRAGQP